MEEPASDSNPEQVLKVTIEALETQARFHRGRAHQLQVAADALKDDLKRLRTDNAPAPVKPRRGEVDSLVREMISDVPGAMTLTQLHERIKQKMPHAKYTTVQSAVRRGCSAGEYRFYKGTYHRVSKL